MKQYFGQRVGYLLARHWPRKWQRKLPAFDPNLHDDLLEDMLEAVCRGNLALLEHIANSANFKLLELQQRQYLLNRCLVESCCAGCLEAVKFLTSSPQLPVHAKVEFKTALERSALSEAACYGYTEIVRYLLQPRIMDSMCSPYNIRSLLQNSLEQAFNQGHVEVVKLLLPLMPADWKNSLVWSDEIGTKIWQHCQHGCQMQDWKSVKALLLSLNIKCLNFPNQQSMTTYVLWQACQHGNMEMAQFVLSNEKFKQCNIPFAQISHEEKNGESCMTIAAKHGQVEMVKFLTGKMVGMDSERLEKIYDNSFVEACRTNQMEVVHHLLTSGEVMLISKRHHEALFIACALGHVQVLEYLCAQKMCIFNEHHTDALKWAYTNGQLKAVQFLLTSPALDYDRQHPHIQHLNEYGLTVACENGYLDIVIFLLTSAALPPLGIKHPDIHLEHDRPFKKALLGEQISVIKFLLFDYDMPQTPHIEFLLTNNQELRRMFEARKLQQQLTSSLPQSNMQKKKSKV